MDNKKVIVFINTSSRARIDMYDHVYRTYQDTDFVMINPEVDEDFTRFFKYWIVSQTNEIDLMIKTSM